MRSHLLRSRRVGPLLTGLAFAIVVASSANAADFSRRSIDVSELNLDLQTIFIYSFPPLKALMRLYGPWMFALIVLALVFRWIMPKPANDQITQLYGRIVKAPAVVLGLSLFAIVAVVAVASIPVISSVAAQAANQIWFRRGGVPIEAMVKEPEAKGKSLWHTNYKSCSSRGALDLIFADKDSYYMLCISTVQKTSALVFEVRRETGLVSVRSVEAQDEIASDKGSGGRP